ncbi:MAG: permease [Chloroflexi bacterium]|nr:permease [Chloroflexota bacterium]
MNLIETFLFALGKVWETFSGLWLLLLLSVVISVLLKLYVDQDRVANFLRRNQRNGVAMSTALAIGTPFCSCGTTAVVLGMMASTIPWAPIVAFMVASPLTSPQELFYSAGLFGWPFAITFFVASIILGLTGGGIAAFAESKGWLANQGRFASHNSPRADLQPVPVSETFTQPQALLQGQAQFATQGIGVSLALPVIASEPAPSKKVVTFKQFTNETFNTSWKLLAMFLGFAFLGYFLNGLIPQEWIKTAFGSGNVFSVPLAAILGIPFYLNTEASMPLVKAFMDSGMSAGAALAFLITGAGTSIGALAGALTIARWRVIAIVVGTLVAGAIVLGTLYDLLVPMIA